MADTMYNENGFENMLEMFGSYTKESRGRTIVYRIQQGRKPQYTNMEFTIEDCGNDGLTISYYDTMQKRVQTFRHIYRWVDAYELLLYGAHTPASMVYRDAGKTVLAVNETLRRQTYDFRWEPVGGLVDIPDETLECAVELVKYGYIRSMYYDEQNQWVHAEEKVNLCKEGTMWALLDEVRRAFFAGDMGSGTAYINWPPTAAVSLMCNNVRCSHGLCMLALCGYLDYAANRGELHRLLEERKRQRAIYRIPCGPYRFSWQPEEGLRRLDESRFRLAQQIADNRLVRVEPELTGENRVMIWSRNCAEWDTVSTPDELTASILAQHVELNRFPQEELSGRWWRTPVHAGLRCSMGNEECQKCHMNRECVFFYAGYIRYLKDCGMEGVLEEDREWYRQNKQLVEADRNELFSFTLPADLFMDQSEEMFEAAELLQEKNYVSMCRDTETDANGMVWIVIKTCKDVADAEDLKALKQAILEDELDRTNNWRYLSSVGNYSYAGGLKRHILLAGYIDYLRRTGRYESYRLLLAERRRRLEESFDQAKDEVPALDKVKAIAENEAESCLYCIIEGERGTGKQQIVGQIAQILAQKGKIDEAVYSSMTFEELSSKLEHHTWHNFSGNAQAFNYAVYDTFEKRRLYVLTDLKEFLFESRSAKEGDGSRASHLIKLLGRYEPQTYIIIISEKRYVRPFLELSPKIKFLFGGNVIGIDNLKPEEIYDHFCDRLSDSLRDELDAAPAFREEFLNYIALNNRLLPLNNQELADYLADYANNQKKLILPPGTRTQSAKEMLRSVIGMSSVKKTVSEFEKFAMFVKRAELSGMKLPQNNMHMIFTGNPGTGKTMIARIIAQMLFDLGVVSENKLIEVERKDLVAGYVGQTAIKTGEVINKALNGVLFVDEAYSLASKSGSDFGGEAIATLIKAMEDHKDKFVVIFAGYEKEMHDFLNINPGIASRIGYTFHFDDYTVEELTAIFDVKMKKAGFEYDEEILNAVRDVCGHFVQKRNFGNGRFVDKVMQSVMLKHSAGENSIDDLRRIIPADIPSVEELVSTDVVEHKDFELQLNEFIGMENVKQKVRQFAGFVQFQQAAKAAGTVIPAGNMHMIFTGNPGTGKTTIARIMVDMLYNIGILKENKLIEVERKDLVAEYVGQTAAKTAEVIERALDGVLFVDEAYTLASGGANDFGAEAVATLIKAMEDHKSDLIVIFAGYKEEMRQFLNVNPGIASRIGYTFDFKDYSPDELVRMYQMKMEKARFHVSEKALKKVRILVEYFSKRKHFGNGRFVAKLQQETFVLHARNVSANQAGLLEIGEQDIPEISDINNTVKSTEKSVSLDSIIGMADVKEQVKEFEHLVNFQVLAREHGLTVPSANLHMIFTGNPGTGKTTIARIIAKKLYDIGAIKENKLVETERKDLVAGYIGQTAPKVSEVVEKAMGGVLFVDEAYTLTPTSPSDYGGEAIATLIKAMEDHKDDLVVIFAGYQEEMCEFENANPGIASRIGFHIHFPDYNAGELRKMFVQKLKDNGFTVTQAAQEKAERLMQYFCHVKNFGNGRFADKIIQNTLALHAKNYRVEAMEVIDEDDIPEIRDVAATMSGGEWMIDPEQVTKEERQRVAFHEVGHALLQSRLFPDAWISTITINTEGTGTLGYVEHQGMSGVQNTRTAYKHSLAVKMAGLAAEQVFLGDYADIGSADIRSASSLARTMITRFGMSRHGFAGSQDEQAISGEINELLQEGYELAVQTLEKDREGAQKAAEYLLEKGRITQEEFRAFLA